MGRKGVRAKTGLRPKQGVPQVNKFEQVQVVVKWGLHVDRHT